ncbi:hypothetical protein N0V94_002845 [Neodidymelliopsis sp. IMI 364377]|nr:hypothetical protein N0V94_002845 [Neodidymelliopsis sp. IMI 364377]
MAVTRSREKSTKAKPAKAKPKGASRTSVPRPAKRSASAVSKDERASKARKIVPKANSGKRVNGRGASIADAISISDDDNGAEKPQRKNIVSIKLPKRILQLSNLVNEDELNQEPSGKADLEHRSLQTDAAHEKDLQHLQQQLAAAKAKIMELQHDAEWKAISLIRQQDIEINKQRAELEEAIEAERAGLSDRSWECAQLHRELEAERSRLKGESNLIQERDEYERLYKEGQAINTKLLRSLQERDEESVRNLTRSAGEIRNLTAQLSSLQGELSQLKQESAFLETPSPPSQQPFTTRSTTSPSPPLSQSSSPTDTRLANIRKTYITVKRQYDCLRSIAMNISTATRSWDCNGFGEFGGYLKQLRVVLQESGREGEMHGRKVTGGGGVGKVE